MGRYAIDYNTRRKLKRIPAGEWPQASQEAAELPEILKHPSAPSAAVRRWREQQGRNRRPEAS